MKLRPHLTAGLGPSSSRVCFGFALGVVVLVIVLLGSGRSPHDASADAYALLTFNRNLESNAVSYASFTITNRYAHPLSFYVNNIQILTDHGWRYEASWLPGDSRVHPKLGSLDNSLGPGCAQTFLVPVPNRGVQWRIHVGVLRGIEGLTVKNRALILWRTHSISAAFTSNPGLTTGYHQFKFAGMLNSPNLPLIFQPGARRYR